MPYFVIPTPVYIEIPFHCKAEHYHYKELEEIRERYRGQLKGMQVFMPDTHADIYRLLPIKHALGDLYFEDEATTREFLRFFEDEARQEGHNFESISEFLRQHAKHDEDAPFIIHGGDMVADRIAGQVNVTNEKLIPDAISHLRFSLQRYSSDLDTLAILYHQHRRGDQYNIMLSNHDLVLIRHCLDLNGFTYGLLREKGFSVDEERRCVSYRPSKVKQGNGIAVPHKHNAGYNLPKSHGIDQAASLLEMIHIIEARANKEDFRAEIVGVIRECYFKHIKLITVQIDVINKVLLWITHALSLPTVMEDICNAHDIDYNVSSVEELLKTVDRINAWFVNLLLDEPVRALALLDKITDSEDDPLSRICWGRKYPSKVQTFKIGSIDYVVRVLCGHASAQPEVNPTHNVHFNVSTDVIFFQVPFCSSREELREDSAFISRIFSGIPLTLIPNLFTPEQSNVSVEDLDTFYVQHPDFNIPANEEEVRLNRTPGEDHLPRGVTIASNNACCITLRQTATSFGLSNSGASAGSSETSSASVVGAPAGGGNYCSTRVVGEPSAVVQGLSSQLVSVNADSAGAGEEKPLLSKSSTSEDDEREHKKGCCVVL